MRIQSVGLGTPPPPLHLNARRIDHNVVDSRLEQPPVQPETIAPRFVAAHNLRPRRQPHTLLRLLHQLEQPHAIAGLELMSAYLNAIAAQGDLPLRRTELQRHIQLTVNRDTLALQDFLRRIHFSSSSVENGPSKP